MIGYEDNTWLSYASVKQIQLWCDPFERYEYEVRGHSASYCLPPGVVVMPELTGL